MDSNKKLSYKSSLVSEKIPAHVAIIMDGNGRWAKKRGNLRIFGHKRGVDSVRNIVEASAEIGVKFLTIYAFSTENWLRPKTEVSALMSLLVSTINSEVKVLNKNNVRLLAIGDMDSLPMKVKNKFQTAIEQTSGNTGLTLVVALSYSSKWEIINAVKMIQRDIALSKINIDNISENLFSQYLSTRGIPDPELLIRTSGEQRISNFLLWQIAYSELYFTETLWPDFGKEDFFKAIYDYQNRERRFGKTSEQIVNNE